MASAFLSPGSITKDGHIASLRMSHSHSIPVILSTLASTDEEKGYAEGVVTNTKFGSFPHSTLLNVPWGSQIRASKVDTGSRGRIPNYGEVLKKRKADEMSTDSPESGLKEATTADSGYLHILPPTPENWTTSLPHRTQVVYTPDYSYILHRIQARPRSVVIEAGSGSGSFTHAAARAVFDGYVPPSNSETNGHAAKIMSDERHGHIYTFEFHPERHVKVQDEMKLHRLDDLVTATHRDVYKDGFLLKDEEDSFVSPSANVVFLDLPAPWEALRHLTRECEDNKPSALDPTKPVHICTFSPCIEQVQKTVSAMRKYGWVEIDMVEIQHKRIEVRREFTGYKYDGMRNVNAYPADVDEAVSKLRTIEYNWQEGLIERDEVPIKKTKITEQNAQIDAAKVLYKEGRIIHRTEPEVKAHTSYLVFAILPTEWTEEDEEHAKEMLQANINAAPTGPKSHRQLKRDAKLRKRLANGTINIPKE